MDAFVFFNLNTVIILSILPPDSVDATGQPGKSTLLLIWNLFSMSSASSKTLKIEWFTFWICINIFFCFEIKRGPLKYITISQGNEIGKIEVLSIVDSYNFLMAPLKHNSFLCSRCISILLNRLLRDFCRTWVFLHLMFLVHCLNGPGVFQIIFLKTFKKFLIILWSHIVVLLLYKCGCIINIINLCYICFVWIIYFLF